MADDPVKLTANQEKMWIAAMMQEGEMTNSALEALAKIRRIIGTRDLLVRHDIDRVREVLDWAEVPSTHILVPRKPTLEMMAAAWDHTPLDMGDMNDGYFGKAYEDMIAAAPALCDKAAVLHDPEDKDWLDEPIICDD